MKKMKRSSQDSLAPRPPEVVRVHKILGQLRGIEKMIDSRRPWPQILQQVQAAISGLASLKMELLKHQLNECLRESSQTANYSKLVTHVLEIVQIQSRK